MTNKTNENKEDKDFPGYPHYPAKEDIMNVQDIERVDADVENLSRSNNPGKVPVLETPVEESTGENDDYNRISKLDTADLDEDGLDVPGSEDDELNEEIGEEDEENKYYSLGGDNHENLEEDNS